MPKSKGVFVVVYVNKNIRDDIARDSQYDAKKNIVRGFLLFFGQYNQEQNQQER